MGANIIPRHYQQSSNFDGSESERFREIEHFPLTWWKCLYGLF